MKSSIVAVFGVLKMSISIPISISIPLGFISLALSISSSANAVELSQSVPDQVISQSTVLESANQEKPTKAESDSNPQSTSPIFSQVDQLKPQLGTRKEDQVDVKDVPQDCRAYFPLSGSVDLFYYRQGMELCKYGR